MDALARIALLPGPPAEVWAAVAAAQAGGVPDGCRVWSAESTSTERPDVILRPSSPEDGVVLRNDDGPWLNVEHFPVFLCSSDKVHILGRAQCLTLSDGLAASLRRSGAFAMGPWVYLPCMRSRVLGEETVSWSTALKRLMGPVSP